MPICGTDELDDWMPFALVAEDAEARAREVAQAQANRRKR